MQSSCRRGFGSCRLLPVFNPRSHVLRELGERTSCLGVIVVRQEVLLILTPVMVAVPPKQRRGTRAVIGNKPLAHLSERGGCGLLRSEDFFKHPSRLECEREGTGPATLPHHIRRLTAHPQHL